VAVIVAVDSEATAVVLAVNVADDFPAPIVTVAGTVTDFKLLESLTVNGVAVFVVVSVTVPVDGPPPGTVDGLMLTHRRVGVFTCSVAVCVTPP
jgi:hypothetical protein